MKRLFLAACTATFIFPSGPGATAGTYPDNPYVRLEVALSADTARLGETVALLIWFHPASGIHINSEPPVGFGIDSTAGIATAGPAEGTVDATNGFLSVRTPVRQPLEIAGTGATGVRTLCGSVTYYYCSDREGWCMKYRQRISIQLVVTG